MTKLANVLEGGLAGATTLSLLTNTLRKTNGTNSHTNLFDGNNLSKRFKKARSKKPLKAAHQYIELAGDLLSSTAFLGLAPFQKKKSAMLRGALLGTAAGLGMVLLKDEDEKSKFDRHGNLREADSLMAKAMQVGLYTIGGAIAGKLLEGNGKKKKRKRK